MDRLERLVNLVAALIEAERPLSRQSIRQRVGGYAAETEAFRRNFERDKDLLRQMGLPLISEPLDPKRPEGPVGYRIPRERYELPDPGLDPDELAALHLAASSVSVDAGWSRDAGTTALRKLAATTGLGTSGTLPSGSLEPSGGSGPSGLSGPSGSSGSLRGAAFAGPPRRVVSTELPADERVAVAFGAVAERQAVRFTYRGAPRKMDPWHLSFRRGQWYLSGLDHDRQTERMFRLDRVDGPLQLDGAPGAFTRPHAGAAQIPAPWRIGDDEETVADLWVDALQADWAAAELGADTSVVRHDDGSARFAVVVTNRSAFRSFVLGLLDHAEILGPPELRGDIVDWLASQAGSQ